MATIEVVCIDADTGKTIGRASMPAERLPERFDVETTMHLGSEDWLVVSADPMTVEDYLRSGSLVLTLRKIIKLPPQDILFTLPTICDVIPRIIPGSSRQGKQVVELHEDDWRQIELVASSYREAISAELEAIRQIYQQASVPVEGGMAFRTLHVRQRILTPLQHGIMPDQIKRYFPSSTFAYESLAYQRMEGLLEGGFTCVGCVWCCFGQQVEGMVTVLGIHGQQLLSEAVDLFAYALADLMAKEALLLVDWCQKQVLSADPTGIAAYLQQIRKRS